jgi:hypothetical protein
MFCDYKINSITDLGNKVRVNAYFNEGEYQENPETHEMEYVRLNQIGKATLMFEKSPVEEDEINKELKRSLEDIKGDREIIPECL